MPEQEKYIGETGYYETGLAADKIKQPQIGCAPYRWHTVGEIKPAGWLRQQLRIQADGLSGHLDQFWPDIADSRWIGGSHEGWERVPYWLDGFIPLAWLLDDEDLKKRARCYIDQILARQEEDGWICPCSREEREHYDLWALFLILKVLTGYADATSDPRVESAVERALLQLDSHLDQHVLSGWGQMRWYEALISIYWLYRKKPQMWLTHLAVKLHSQGFDFPSLLSDGWPYRLAGEKGKWSQMSHVVNQAMMLKGWALYALISGKKSDREAAGKMLEELDSWHGQVHGLFSGDECLAGTSPIRGTELCAVVEFMYSLEQLLVLTGDCAWGDRLERAAFNALPATFDPTMWTHQYDQQVNQVACITQKESVFGTNGGQANLFGLEPNFGCCTANLNQGWPKFAQSLILHIQGDDESPEGLFFAAYAPARLQTTVGGKKVKLDVKTEYPFRESVKIKIATETGNAFPIEWRVPIWTKRPQIKLRFKDGKKEKHELKPAEKFTLSRDWSEIESIQLHFPFNVSWQKRPNDFIALLRGPLVYALPVKESWQRINLDLPGHEEPHADYEVLPAGPWQYGLKTELLTEEAIIWEEQEIGKYPFSPQGAPVKARLRATPLKWLLQSGSGSVKPEPESRNPAGPDETVELIPYGCTNLRLTEFPIV